MPMAGQVVGVPAYDPCAANEGGTVRVRRVRYRRG